MGRVAWGAGHPDFAGTGLERTEATEAKSKTDLASIVNNDECACLKRRYQIKSGNDVLKGVIVKVKKKVV